MAKKKAAPAVNPASQPAPSASRGAPQKQCPKCGKSVHARTRLCSCGHEFAAAAPKEPGAVGSKPRKGGADAEKIAMTFVLFDNGGNVGKALDTVAKYEVSPIGELIEQLGGKANAVKVLEAMKERQAS